MKQIWFIKAQKIKNAIFQALYVASMPLAEQILWSKEQIYFYIHAIDTQMNELEYIYLFQCAFSVPSFVVGFFWKCLRNVDEFPVISLPIVTTTFPLPKPAMVHCEILPARSNFSDTLRARAGRFVFSLSQLCFS